MSGCEISRTPWINKMIEATRTTYLVLIKNTANSLNRQVRQAANALVGMFLHGGQDEMAKVTEAGAQTKTLHKDAVGTSSSPALVHSIT